MSHTPGPWTTREWSCHAKTTVVSEVGGVVAVLAECHAGGVEAETAIANARLIAALPELLAVLKDAEIFAHCDRGCTSREDGAGCSCGYEQWWSRMNAAIAKAEGK